MTRRRLIELLDHPELATRLAAAGREKARRDYDWSTISKRLLALYADVIERG